MKTSTVVILGGNEMACPAIERIARHGFKVIVMDGNKQAPAARIAHSFLNIDFSSVSAASDALASYQFDGIVPLNDFGVAAAANIARNRGLPGWNEFAQRCFTSKIAMKQAWEDKGLRTARWTSTTVAHLLDGRLPAWDIWPAVVKPSFSGGGSRGVVVARGWDEVLVKLDAERTQYRDGHVVIEEFIAGTEHTLEVLICRGKPTLLSISDKENYPGSDTVVQNLYFPGPIGHSYRVDLEALVVAACRAMQLTDGTAHFEVLIKHGVPFLLEVGGRPGGGLNLQPICELSTGFDYPGLLAATLCGREPDFDRREPVHLAWHYFSVGEGLLHAVEGFDELASQPDVVHSEMYEKVGSPRLDIRNDLARPGYVLVKANSHAQARARAATLVSQVKFS
jgi:biotin carboxylase